MSEPFLSPLGDDSHPLEPSMMDELEEQMREDDGFTDNGPEYEDDDDFDVLPYWDDL